MITKGSLKEIGIEDNRRDVITQDGNQGASAFNVKMERPLEDQEVNTAYWYHLWWRHVESRVGNFDENKNGKDISQLENKKKK